MFTGRIEAEVEAPNFWSPNARPISLEKPLMLANIEGQRRRGRQMLRWLDGITSSMGMSFPGSGPSGPRVIRRWRWSQCPWKNTYLITDI